MITILLSCIVSGFLLSLPLIRQLRKAGVL